jgi:hypothetical protein
LANWDRTGQRQDRTGTDAIGTDNLSLPKINYFHSNSNFPNSKALPSQFSKINVKKEEKRIICLI